MVWFIELSDLTYKYTRIRDQFFPISPRIELDRQIKWVLKSDVKRIAFVVSTWMCPCQTLLSLESPSGGPSWPAVRASREDDKTWVNRLLSLKREYLLIEALHEAPSLICPCPCLGHFQAKANTYLVLSCPCSRPRWPNDQGQWSDWQDNSEKLECWLPRLAGSTRSGHALPCCTFGEFSSVPWRWLMQNCYPVPLLINIFVLQSLPSGPVCYSNVTATRRGHLLMTSAYSTAPHFSSTYFQPRPHKTKPISNHVFTKGAIMFCHESALIIGLGIDRKRWISLLSGRNQEQAAISNPPPPPPRCTRPFSQELTVAEWCDGLSPRLNNSRIPVLENVLLEAGLYQFIVLYGLIVCGRWGWEIAATAQLPNLHWNEKKVWCMLFFPSSLPYWIPSAVNHHS